MDCAYGVNNAVLATFNVIFADGENMSKNLLEISRYNLVTLNQTLQKK